MKSMLRSLRCAVLSKAASLQLGGFATQPKVNQPCRFTRQTFLGRNCNFNGLEVQGSGVVRIGDNFHSGPGCLFITSMHDYDRGNAIPYGDAYVHKDITIEDNVWLGSRVIILGGVTIGEGAIVQAGAVVVKSIPALGIAGGNPATVFKTRNADHYYRLKAAGSFH
jgi:chloramphenicol O-acetyltransferase type B